MRCENFSNFREKKYDVNKKMFQLKYNITMLGTELHCHFAS